jgi:hypothetical protein
MGRVTQLACPAMTVACIFPVPTWTCPSGRYASALISHIPGVTVMVPVVSPGAMVAVAVSLPFVAVIRYSSDSITLVGVADLDPEPPLLVFMVRWIFPTGLSDPRKKEQPFSNKAAATIISAKVFFIPCLFI